MSADQLARQWADSIVIQERDLPELSEDHAGVVYYERDFEGATFAAVRFAGLSQDRAATFDAWARHRAYVVASTGDLEIDGWLKPSTDERWQLTARAEDLPDMRFLEA